MKKMMTREALPAQCPDAIHGERVTLLPIAFSHLDDVFREFTSQIVIYMIPKSPDHIGETREFIEKSVADREQSTEFIFVILHKVTHEFLGVCALHGSRDPLRPGLGLWLKKSAHGNRYGLEAIRSLIEWAQRNLRIDEFVYPVDRRNIPSRKIAEALDGVVVEEKRTPTMRGTELDTLVYVIPVTACRRSEE
jgi:[ribosomal protein S5]-alanine N-acetyltransferase